MNESARSGLPDRRKLMQISGFCAGISLIAYLAGGVGVSHAAAIFMVFWAGILGSWFASRTYPAIGEYRRSLPDTLKYAPATGLLFGLTVYLVLYFMGRAGSLNSPGEVMRLLILVASWFGCAMFLEWVGREPRA